MTDEGMWAVNAAGDIVQAELDAIAEKVGDLFPVLSATWDYLRANDVELEGIEALLKAVGPDKHATARLATPEVIEGWREFRKMYTPEKAGFLLGTYVRSDKQDRTPAGFARHINSLAAVVREAR